MKKLIISLAAGLSVQSPFAMQIELIASSHEAPAIGFIEKSLQNIPSFPTPLRELKTKKRHQKDLRALLFVLDNVKTQINKSSRAAKYKIDATSKTRDIDSYKYYWAHSLSAFYHRKYIKLFGCDYNNWDVAAYHIRSIAERCDWTPEKTEYVLDTFFLVYGKEYEKAAREIK